MLQFAHLPASRQISRYCSISFPLGYFDKKEATEKAGAENPPAGLPLARSPALPGTAIPQGRTITFADFDKKYAEQAQDLRAKKTAEELLVRFSSLPRPLVPHYIDSC